MRTQDRPWLDRTVEPYRTCGAGSFRLSEASDEGADEGFDFGQRKVGRDLVYIMDVPVGDPVFPTGELLPHQGSVLCFLESDNQVGRGEIIQGSGPGIANRFGDRDVAGFEGLEGVRRNRSHIGGISTTREESAGMGLPAQLLLGGQVVEEAFREPASIIVTSA